MTTRTRFALIICVTLIPVIGATVFSNLRERRVLLEHINEDVMGVTRTAAGIQEMAINNALQLLTALAENPEMDYRSWAGLLSNVRNRNPVYTAIGLVRADGSAITVGSEISTAGIAGRINEGKEFALDIRLGESGRKTGLILSRYFHFRSSGSKAALFAVLDMKMLSGYADLQLPYGAEYVLITGSGTILAADPDVGEDAGDAPLVQTMLARREGTCEMKGLDGRTRLYAFRPLSGAADTGIYVAIGFPTSVYSEVDKILAFDLFILALSLLSGIIIWGLADRTVIRNVDSLVATARRLSGGEMQARTGIDYGTSGEMGRIAKALDQMADILENRTGQLYSYQEQLRSMASELLLVEERERHRIATEMHDRIGQALAISKIRLGALIKSDKSGPTTAELAGVKKYIDQAILDTRSIIYKISSPILYELGLEAALEWLAEQFQKEHGIRSAFLTDGIEKPLDEDGRVLLFQAVGELLVNVVKHADASRVAIRCKRDGGNIRIEVEDNGSGFDPESTSMKRHASTGFGLFSIRERLKHINGELEILSSPEAGTKVILKVPLKDIEAS